MNTKKAGYFAAVLTIFIWGTTYISTKVLLKDFSPVEILYIRFVMGYAALWIACPHRLRLTSRKQHFYLLAAGFSGITLYYLLENIALTFTLASHVGVIISIAPFFTAVGGIFVNKEEKPSVQFFIGFVIAMAGICLMSFQKGAEAGGSLFGDFLALLAALVWAVYALCSKKISSFGFSTILTTRRTFFYGLIFMSPLLFTGHFQVSLREMTSAVNIGNLLFLGLGASALCFVTWNFAVRSIGAIGTSVFIYMVPVITAITSVLILHEPMPAKTFVGMILTMAGLFLSQKRKDERKP